MGTVGLSFGSATSGQGFDVSSTVSQIVSNLQNVETPWKTQLTSLESQDTVISSLGTLFSTLSTSMSSLTDFEGVMAQKEGSTSDSGVLTLTAADSTATAGTHTVTVTNLAATSSGYLAKIASATSTLSGSITLQAGSGTALTLKLSSADNTLATLAKTINASGVGITANVLTDSTGSRLSLVSSTSGAAGNITVSANSIVAASASLSYSGSAATNSANSAGTLTAITNASDKLTGSILIQVGSGAAKSVKMPTSPNNTLTGLMNTINGTTGIGVTASVVTNSNGSSSLKLVSDTPLADGNLTVNSGIVDTSNSLGYTTSVTGADANLTVNGVDLTSASNTVSDVIAGVTFQLLAPSAKESDGSLEQVQVVIANDNAGVESAISGVVSNYNAAMSAVNTQEGRDSSGKAEPLFGSPTLSLLQQQLLNGINTSNPNGYLTAISNSTNTTLAGSMTITVGSGTAQTFVMGSGVNTGDTFYAGSGVNTLTGLMNVINAANADTQLSYVDAGTTSSTAADSGTLSAATDKTISGEISIEVGGGTAENIVIGAEPSTGAAANTFYTGSGVNTLSGLADTINSNSTSLGVTAVATTAANGVTTLTLTSGTTGSAGTLTVTPSILVAGIGFTASVATKNGESSLALASETAGASGALTVSSSIAATSDTPLSYSGSSATDTENSNGTLTSIPSGSDALNGSISIQVGSGVAQTIKMPSSPNNNLSGLASAINTAGIGVIASAVENNNGTWGLSLWSETSGSAGDLTVTSKILDTTDTTQATLSYTNSSDINSLTSLGISVNNDGSLTFDAANLDSVLNSDYSGVVGFFQNANSWGQTFSTTLTEAGISSTKGILALASTSNSNIESTLNADVSKEETQISAQQKSLTAELNSANEIMQGIPTQLDGINELYSAVTGYNKSSS